MNKWVAWHSGNVPERFHCTTIVASTAVFPHELFIRVGRTWINIACHPHLTSSTIVVQMSLRYFHLFGFSDSKASWSTLKRPRHLHEFSIFSPDYKPPGNAGWRSLLQQETFLPLRSLALALWFIHRDEEICTAECWLRNLIFVADEECAEDLSWKSLQILNSQKLLISGE